MRLVASETRRTWIYRYKSAGLMKQVKLGEWPAMDWAAALSAWGDQRSSRASGADPAEARREARQRAAASEAAAKAARAAETFTVRKLCDSYLETLSMSRKAKGVAETGRLLERLLGDVAGMHPAQVTRSVAYDLIISLADTPVQAKNLRGELGAVWEHGYDSGRLSEDVPNWWRQILRGKLKSKGRQVAGEAIKQKRVLSDEEMGTLINWLPNYSKNAADALTLYGWTLCRGAEIVAMHADEIRREPDGVWWQIPKAKTKNAGVPIATDHRVPLVGRALDVVERRLAAKPESGYLFAQGRKGAKLPHIEQKAVGLAVWHHMPYSGTESVGERPRCPVTHWAPHDLRRTSRTLLASLGCPNEVAEAMLGHVPPGVVGVYNLHSYNAERRLWVTRLDAKLEQLVTAAKGGG